MNGASNQERIDAGVLVMRRTIQELAMLHGLSEADLLTRMAEQEIASISRHLDMYAKLNVPPSLPDVVLLLAERDKIVANPEYALDHRQSVLERSFVRWVSQLNACLLANKDALGMLDASHLESIERGLELPSDGALSDRAARIASAVQIVSPLMGGFGSQASPLAHTVRLHHGIQDCFWLAGELICGMAIEDEVDGVLRVRQMRDRLRDRPKEFSLAIKRLREIIEFAAGKVLSIRTLIGDRAQASIAARLSEGATLFVVFHELGHILLPPLPDARDEEYACDAFASRLIVGSRDPALICGLNMGLFLMNAIILRASGHKDSGTHPSISSRFDRVATITETGGMPLTGAWDVLLSIPTRLMEEEVFTSETQPSVLAWLRTLLENVKSPMLHSPSFDAAANRLAAEAIRLPTVFELAEPTLQDENGKRVRIVRFDLLAATKVLREVFGVPLGTAGVVGVYCLATIAGKRPPDDDAALVFAALSENHGRRSIAKLAKTFQGRLNLDECLSSLERLGCLSVKGSKVSISRGVTLRIPTSIIKSELQPYL